MPIRPENKDRYPPDWPEISKRIRKRAHNMCECTGECGHDHVAENNVWREGLEQIGWPMERCGAVNGGEHPVTGSKVVLTVAHLDHQPENCEAANLRAMCQRCHLAYDAEHHAASRRENERKARATVEMDF